MDILTGRLCVDFLDDASEWNPNYSLIMILCQIQNMLAHPVVRNPINLHAAEMYCNSPRLYDQIARDSVIASRRIAGEWNRVE